MKDKKKVLFLTLILLIISCSALDFIDCKMVSGAATKFWKQTKYEDFINGNAVNVAIYNSRGVRLAPKTEDISGINASYIWCMAKGQYGDVFAGTGNPGAVYKITEQKKAVEIFRAPEGLHIQAITADNHGNIFAGTIPSGTIYKINSEMKTSLFCSLPELYIWDMAVDNSGQLFAATGNMGRIYKISEHGDAEVILDSEAAHILDLEINDNNDIFACSEPLGLIYKITPQGNVSVLYDAKEDEVHCLTLGRNGALYAGTASNWKPHIPAAQGDMSKIMAGLSDKTSDFFPNVEEYGLTADGKSWADFGLVVEPQTVQPLVDHLSENDPDLAVEPQNAEDEKAKDQTTVAGMFFPFDNLPTRPNVVYEILPNGNAKLILELDNVFVFSLIFDEKNSIYAGTGNEAAIYQIELALNAFTSNGSTSNGLPLRVGIECLPIEQTQDNVNPFDGNAQEHVAALFHPKSSQVLSLIKTDNDAFYAGTGNNGSVFKVSNEFSTSGIYESPVHDASINSRWGRISWDADIVKGTMITLFTRTGNSQTPDCTWSDWEPIRWEGIQCQPIQWKGIQYQTPLIEGLESCRSERSGVILSPQARFIQYRAEFTTINNHATPVLKGVSISYLPDNQAPKIASVNIKNDNKDSQPTSSDRPKNDRIEIKPLHTPSDRNNNQKGNYAKKLITWDVQEPDNDQLLFDLYFKKAGEMNWQPLARDIRGKNIYTWETNSIADGKYQIKISASDILSNPKEKALQSALISQPFPIDNTRPVITDIRVLNTEDGGCKVTGTASDNMSNISSMQYSVDAGDLGSVFPADQLFDYKNEVFQFTALELTKGQHTVIINAIDSENNIGSERISVGIK